MTFGVHGHEKACIVSDILAVVVDSYCRESDLLKLLRRDVIFVDADPDTRKWYPFSAALLVARQRRPVAGLPRRRSRADAPKSSARRTGYL